jgi:hypothetical protein
MIFKGLSKVSHPANDQPQAMLLAFAACLAAM